MTNYNSGYGLAGSYGGGLYGNNMYRGGYGGSNGFGGMYNNGIGGPMGGYGMGPGGPYDNGNGDPNDPFGGPPSPPSFWQSMLHVVSPLLLYFLVFFLLLCQHKMYNLFLILK